MRRGGVVAVAMVLGWYALALATLHPLADGPVADSWIYAESVRWFRASGEFRFVGYTEAMPLAQILYGAAWGSIFGTSAVSFDLANVCLAIVAALMLYGLAIRCGAPMWQALVASALLVCNPCFLFLSFSFMSEIGFIAALVGSHLAFACWADAHRMLCLWIAAGLALIAFSIRPFGGIAIIGPLAAMLIYDAKSIRWRSVLMPFAIALIGCGLIWLWMTVLRPAPWKLLQRETVLANFLRVAPWEYLRMGVLGPLLYLGIVLSPLAILRLNPRALMLAAAIFVTTVIVTRVGIAMPSTPEMSCFGGWSNALILRGLPNRFEWHDAWRYALVLLGSLGAAGFIFAAIDAIPNLTRASSAVVIAAAVYWLALIPLWLFNDRYFLVLLPAAALILAMAPMPEHLPMRIAVFAMTFVMGVMSLGGVYSYQRGLAAVMAARDALEKRGVTRADIDAGYELNGLDLYPFPDDPRHMPDVPMITSSKLSEYTIAAAPIDGTEMVATILSPGPFGLGSRRIYVVRRIDK